MRLVEIAGLPNGGHRNQTVSGTMRPPEGWAVIPDDMETANFPFGSLTVEAVEHTRRTEEGEEKWTVMTVTQWTAGEMPEQEPGQPTQLDIIEAQTVYTAMMTNTLLEV